MVLIQPPRPPRGSTQPRAQWFILALAGMVSFTTLAAIPHDALHPLALLAGLLPLQMAALLWGVTHMR